MDQTSITAAGVIDTFLVLLTGVGRRSRLSPTACNRFARRADKTSSPAQNAYHGVHSGCGIGHFRRAPPGPVVVFRWADAVSAKLDENRMLVTEKVFGFLIAAIAVQLVLDGLASVGVISHLNH